MHSALPSVQADTTDPDICMIEEAYLDLERKIVGITVTAQDYDSPMLYYSYSYDGGVTYTPYLAWPETDIMAGFSPDTFTFEIQVPDNISPAIVVRAVNQYDRYRESNLLTGFPVFVSTPEARDTSFFAFLKLCLFAATLLFIALLITNLLTAKKRRQKRKPPRRR